MTLGDYFKKAINTDHLALKDGDIRLQDFRMVMLPAFTWTRFIEKLYERHGEEAFELFFEAGREHGKYAVEKYGKEHDIPKKQFLDQAMDSSRVLGIGIFEMEKLNFESGEAVFKVENSPFPEYFGKSDVLSDLDRPIDELHRGMLHSACKEILGQDVESEETHCRFKGDSYCRFVVKTKKSDAE